MVYIIYTANPLNTGSCCTCNFVHYSEGSVCRKLEAIVPKKHSLFGGNY